MNIKLLKKIKRRILRDPQAFRMDHWNCGTAACIAGHACAISGKVVTKYGDVFPSERAHQRGEGRRWIGPTTERLLGITDQQFTRLCRWDPDDQAPYWPEPFLSRFKAAHWRKVKARIAAERIDHFIATNGAE